MLEKRGIPVSWVIMRIGIDATTVYTSRPTGLDTFSINVVNELVKLHDDVIIWTVEDGAFSVPGDKVRKVLPPVRFLGNGSYQFRRPWWVELRLPSLLHHEKVDVLYTTVLSAKTRCQIPQVVTIHDLFPLTFPKDSTRAVRCNYRLRVPTIIQNADAIIAVSRYTKSQILEHFAVPADKIHVVYEGYDASNFTPRHDPAVLRRYGLDHHQFILTVGDARSRKNLDRVVQAFASVKDKIPHKLVMVGPKTEADVRHLTNLAGRCHVRDRVVLLNYVSYQELPIFYSSAALFMFLSLFEGFGLPILEAMACGAPVMASNTSSIPEVAGDAALLVDPFDVTAIGAAMVSMISDGDLLDKLSQAGIQRCRQFSWRAAAQKILDICTNCVDGLPATVSRTMQ